jgi:hypothetical protein
MDDNTNHINYTAEDIKQYLSGKLSPLQMNAMEKAALDDPFLAEAMEGYEAMPAREWDDALSAVKKQLVNKEGNGAKIIAMPMRKNNSWKAAAAILLLAATAVTSYLILNRKESAPQIAKNIVVAPPIQTDSINNQTENITFTDSQSNGNAAIASATDTKKLLDKNVNQLNSNQIFTSSADRDSMFVYTPPASLPAANTPAAEKVTESDLVQGRKEFKSEKPNAVTSSGLVNNSNTAESNYYKNSNLLNTNTPANKGYAYNYNDKNNERQILKKDAASGIKDVQFNRFFSAQVVGVDNTPLPFANVSIKSENFGTYADAKGNFRLVSPDTVLTVEVKSIGYQPKTYTIKSNLAQNKITLIEDDMSAKAKTVINTNAWARTKTSRRATLIKDSIVNVEPADGWDKYNTYVDNNIEIPDDILNNNIHGQVQLSFDVQANGTITNIKVDKSLCDNCDELAKRLLEQGPQWKVKKGKKGKGKVTLQF